MPRRIRPSRLAGIRGVNASPVDFSISEDGRLAPARQCPSPNRDRRPAGCEPELIVLHGISLPPGEFGGPYIEQFFTNTLDHDHHAYFREIAELRVSAHVLVRRDGEVVQFVPFSERAWHAGESVFRGRGRCNDYSIGIEIEGDDDTAYDERQYDCVARLIASLCRRYPRLDARVVAGHCDIAPGRKTDPGPAFDWMRLYHKLACA